MNNINYQYLLGGLLCIILSVLYLAYITKDLKKNKKTDLFSESQNFQGYLGGIGLLICGFVIIFGELKKII